MEYPFIVFTTRSTQPRVVVLDRAISIGQIELINHLTVGKQMSSGTVRNVTYKLFVY